MARKAPPPLESSPHGEWTTHITLKIAHFVFAVRLIQLIGGFICAAFAVVSMLWTGGYDYYSPPMWVLVPILTISSLITLMGVVGMFAYKRPNDVHWHLMLALDWLTFVGALANVTMTIFSILCVDGLTFGFAVTMTICSIVILFAILMPIIRTHRLAKCRALPPPNTRKETWYHMEDERVPRTPESGLYNPSYTPPAPPPLSAERVRRAPSQAISRADTTARWSGISGATTTAAYPTLIGDFDVPAYSNSGTMSPAMSVIKH